MTDLRQAAMQALDAWDSTVLPVANDGMMQERMEILRETLEQPEQHPVAFVNADHLQGLTLGHYGYAEIYTDESEGRVPVYTTPPAAQPEQGPVGMVKELFTNAAWNRLDVPGSTKVYLVTPPAAQRPWVGLTEEDVKHEWEVWRASLPRYIGFAQGIESKLKERNT